ncbi:MAG: 6-hydroxymethylpterin diphosphokinase MptE-like protein [Lachnospira sp.]
MSVIKSFVFKYQSRVINNFENSKYGKKLKKLKGIHKGKRCFIVANGPSLSINDLNVLADNGEFTFGMNRIFKMFDQTKWRPTFYVCEDINIFNDCVDNINSIDGNVLKFIPINHYFFNDIKVDEAYYFNLNYDKTKDSEFHFSDNIAQKIDCNGTVTFTCINIAVYMGFEEIYLLGVDHNYQVIINEKGETIEDNSVKDYFCDDYDSDIKDKVVHDIGKNTLAYNHAKSYCDKNNIKVLNATRGGKLEVFPRVNFDDLFIGNKNE